jgi:hypothetical protein
MSFFGRLGAALKAFFSSSAVKAVELEIAVKAAPVVEGALSAVAASNPIAEVIVTAVVNPVIASEAKKLQ